MDGTFNECSNGISGDKNSEILQEGNSLKVNGFIIDIAVIENDGLIRMRKMLPKESYRLIKNRKSARLCRLRKKEVVSTIH